MKKYDIIIIGAGAAGLMAATMALARGKRVAVIDMGDAPARKVAVSGGGRCNFTNAAVATNRYFGENPKFIRSAIARTTPTDILDWVSKHNIQWVEKAPGQYFCAGGADDVVHALVHDARGADFFMKTTLLPQGECLSPQWACQILDIKSQNISGTGLYPPALHWLRWRRIYLTASQRAQQ